MKDVQRAGEEVSAGRSLTALARGESIFAPIRDTIRPRPPHDTYEAANSIHEMWTAAPQPQRQESQPLPGPEALPDPEAAVWDAGLPTRAAAAACAQTPSEGARLKK